MSSKEQVVTPTEVNALRRQFDEALSHVVLDRVKYEALKVYLQDEVINPSKGEKARDLAEERRVDMLGYYKMLGFTTEIPKPDISNREFNRRRKAGQELFFHHADKDVSYEEWMIAHGQKDHRTLTPDNRKKIVWEETVEGYWFWAEVQQACPRTGTSRVALTSQIILLSLEEYVIVWYVTKSATGLMLDHWTHCWLRTVYKAEAGLGVMDARELIGAVSVGMSSFPSDLSLEDRSLGGRSSEVVKHAA